MSAVTQALRRLTPAQADFLRRAIEHPQGLVPSVGTANGLGSAARRRMAARLNLAGLIRDYRHGGYEITDAGRTAIAAAEGRKP